MAAHVLIVLAILATALLHALPSYAQPATRTPRVGFVMVGTENAAGPIVEAFRDGLRELGYVEGRNLSIEVRWVPPDGRELLPDIAKGLILSQPDVLVGLTTSVVVALKQATTTIPIVMVAPSDPVGVCLVQSLARPGGNVTGLSLMQTDLMGKRLEVLKETLPKMSRVGHIRHPDPATYGDLAAVEAAAGTMGLSFQSAEVREPEDIVKAFTSFNRARVDAIIVHADPVTWTHRKQIANLALQRRVPTMFSLKEYVEVGGLMSYGSNIVELSRRAAGYVDKILRGSNPADLAVEQPTAFELIINLKTANALGITIPDAVRARAAGVVR